ncbi:DUF881 domain-containing protein [Cellulomonas massiliensis]|uniref:DUF881 domain-containing protein n=1 Tax=Cellulomonas massiliensis TaxID=1465811 RepID=UPI0002F466C1|nr:DUF881 domain-containing protein [Cellulomonas massiliensis]
MSTKPREPAPEGHEPDDVAPDAAAGGPADEVDEERDDRLDESHAAAALTSPLEDLPPFDLPPVVLDSASRDDPPADGRDADALPDAPDPAPDAEPDAEPVDVPAAAGAAEGSDADARATAADGGDAGTGTPDDETAPDGDGPAAPGTRSGWGALGRAMRPRATRAQVLTGVLCAVLGFALVAQVRQAGGDNLSSLRQDELVRILDETTARGEALEQEAADLRDERDELVSGSDRRQAALEALERSAANQGILTGRLPATGRGVVVTLTEVDRALSPVVLLDVLEELRNAGAEAIELNSLRITASSAFTGEAGAVLLDGEPVTSPYLWRVIGDPDAIAPALQIPGGAFAQVRNSGGAASVERSDTVEISSTRELPAPRYAVVEQPSDG